VPQSLRSWNGRTFPPVLSQYHSHSCIFEAPSVTTCRAVSTTIEEPPFQLPTYITDTGIATQLERDAIKEKEANTSLKVKTRERVADNVESSEVGCGSGGEVQRNAKLGDEKKNPVPTGATRGSGLGATNNTVMRFSH
jgi:hypothetical protein